MALLNSSLLCALLFAAMVHLSFAQNSPEDYLNAHNKARAAVGVRPLKWGKDLEEYAQNYANKRINDCKLQHSKGPYGENIAWSSADLSGVEAVRLWVDEKQFYNYGTNTCQSGKVCGHYTQVVWRKTARVGCARVKCAQDRGTFVICSYDPAGNTEGEKPY